MFNRGAQAKQPKNGTHGGVENARIAVAVSTGEVDGLVWLAVAVATDLDLGARGVELCATHGDREMEGDDLQRMSK